MNATPNISQEEWDLIEQFLEEENNNVADTVLRAKVFSIPNAQAKIEYVKSFCEDLENVIRHQKLEEFHNSLPEKELSDLRRFRTRKSQVFWISAAAILIVLIGTLWMMDYRNPAEIQFRKHFKPDVGLPLKMSSESNKFDEGMVDYQQKNYQKAVEKWEELYNNKPTNDTLNYFLGVANLALGDAQEALRYLETQDIFTNGSFQSLAAYYAALAYLKKGDMEQAKIMLQKHPSKENNRLLQDLDQ